ncbi:hypothetical protein [Pseudomonas sp. S2_A02]|jgi:hypothetical protein
MATLSVCEIANQKSMSVGAQIARCFSSLGNLIVPTSQPSSCFSADSVTIVVSSRQLQHKTCPEFRSAPRRQIKDLGALATDRVMQNARQALFETCILQTPDGGFALGEDGSKNAAHPFSIR